MPLLSGIMPPHHLATGAGAPLAAAEIARTAVMLWSFLVPSPVFMLVTFVFFSG